MAGIIDDGYIVRALIQDEAVGTEAIAGGIGAQNVAGVRMRLSDVIET